MCGGKILKGALLVSAQFPTLAFEALLFVLAFSYFAADAWGCWRSEVCKVGDLVQILIRDSTVYFAMYVCFATRSLSMSLTSGFSNVVAAALYFGNSRTHESVSDNHDPTLPCVR